MEEESIADSNNVTADTFSHTSNKERKNAIAIFTSEKLDKLDEKVDAVKKLKINNSKYYESITGTAGDVQGDLTRNMETFTHTSNGSFEQKILSYRKIPVLPPPKNRGIDQGIAPIALAPQMLLNPAPKEVIADVASGGAWIHRTPRQVSSMGIGIITPGDISNSIGIIEPP